jgi:hypothetical protein
MDETYFEDAKERKRSGIDFRKGQNFRPIVVWEFEMSDLSGIGESRATAPRGGLRPVTISRADPFARSRKVVT